ncbi:AraC-like DNA-binding protein [Roseimicrobium gellanilyticum]|uniref:AraC-like DNA-binding protein n=1 Tax=Roseimicrobium gellanilyticum TaxID=748857 RepID=A0A366H3R5_9BACT|nr:AraC family transcriptional regulator [Roseimicrobium gellanilyticum]RBP36620.1 AraC-like DNA-binding protein [Roseimicrobium gellanilyticum]
MQALLINSAQEVARMLDADHLKVPSLEELAKTVGVSPFQLSRSFHQHHGVTIPGYVRRLRMNRAAELLSSTNLSVTEIALEVGYQSLSAFVRGFQREQGRVPTRYRAEMRAKA